MIQAVGTGCDRGSGQVRHQLSLTGGVAGVHNHWQVGQLLQWQTTRAQVQHVAGEGVEAADAPFAKKDDIGVAGGSLTYSAPAITNSSNVAARPRFSRMGLFNGAQGFEQVKVSACCGCLPAAHPHGPPWRESDQWP